MEYPRPPRSLTTLRAIRTAGESPSMENGTAVNDGRELRTNVINGCADATAAPRRRSASSSSLVITPLECSAIRPLQSIWSRTDCEALRIPPSGTQNQTTVARKSLGNSVDARAATSRASVRAFVREAGLERPTTLSILYPARRSGTARAFARFPAPTIAITGLLCMPGSIAEAVSQRCHPDARAVCRPKSLPLSLSKRSCNLLDRVCSAGQVHIAGFINSSGRPRFLAVPPRAGKDVGLSP